MSYCSPKWLIEASYYLENKSLVEEIKKQGMEYIIIPSFVDYDFDTNNYLLNLTQTTALKVNDCVSFCGSIKLLKYLKERAPYYPIGWLNDTSYQCTTYYPIYQKYLFNKDHIFVNISALKDNLYFY